MKKALFLILLLLFGIGLFLFFGPKGDRAVIQKLEDKQVELQERINRGIPEYRKSLHTQAMEIRNELHTAPQGEAASILEDELRDLARLMIALDLYEEECRTTLTAINTTHRRYERDLESGQFIGEESRELLDEFSKLNREAAARLEVTLGRRMGDGPIEQTLIEQKYREISGKR